MQIFSGKIIAGSKRASLLGFPTINIPHSDENVSGIYAGEAEIGGTKFKAAIFADSERKLLEAHLLDFSGEIRGTAATFTLLKKLRESESVADDETLKKMIAEDVERAREYFSAPRGDA